MIFAGLLGLLSALFADSAVPAAPKEGVRVMTVEERLIIRVPVAPHPRRRIHWEEGDDGPKCLQADALVGAFLSGPDTVDFILRGRQFVRARLDSDCDGLDFYGGFYVQPQDRRICAKRDSISVRAGGSCRIVKFHTLTPQFER